MFVTGDSSLAAPARDASGWGHVYAFAIHVHLGPTEFPMTRAYVYTVLPSLFASMKLSSTGEIIGTFLQDRARRAIADAWGPGLVSSRSR